MLVETRNLGGIPAITFTDKAIEPVMKVMHVVDLSECGRLSVDTPWDIIAGYPYVCCMGIVRCLM